MSLMGTVSGSFFKPPEWVDTSKPAGHTSVSVTGYGSSGWYTKYFNLSFFFMSPNLLWFLICLAFYRHFPYDIAAAKQGWAWHWVLTRFALNAVLVLAYTGFWHVSLYWLHWAKRKFNPSHTPNMGRMLHNVFYSLLGVASQTAWECLFTHLWATGKLPYISDDQVFDSPANVARVVFWILAVPIVRDWHFPFAHRFLHYRALYKYIHSLHHRNTDIEPFSGLCMHPIEHLYYMTCMGVSLYFLMHPIHLMFNAFHLVLAPAASHSGWEDNWQSDSFHYLHHTNFECNYGTTAIPTDYWFGTYRDRLGQSTSYKGEGNSPSLASSVAPKPVLRSYVPRGGLSLSDALPTGQFFVYHVFTFALFSTLTYALMHASDLSPSQASGMALLVSVGPIIFASFLWYATNDTFGFLWPFHKESVATLLFHTIVAFFFCILPVYHLVLAGLSPSSVYCNLWSC